MLLMCTAFPSSAGPPRASEIAIPPMDDAVRRFQPAFLTDEAADSDAALVWE